MSEAVLDASALIAFLRREPGGALVEPMLSTAVISSVNLTEVVTRMIDGGIAWEHARHVITETTIETVPFDADLAFAAGALRTATRSRGLSLGDRACLALARRLGVPAVTADRRWSDLDIGVAVQQIRD